jgi:hypothetical protein
MGDGCCAGTRHQITKLSAALRTDNDQKAIPSSGGKAEPNSFGATTPNATRSSPGVLRSAVRGRETRAQQETAHSNVTHFRIIITSREPGGQRPQICIYFGRLAVHTIHGVRLMASRGPGPSPFPVEE